MFVGQIKCVYWASAACMNFSFTIIHTTVLFFICVWSDCLFIKSLPCKNVVIGWSANFSDCYKSYMFVVKTSQGALRRVFRWMSSISFQVFFSDCLNKHHTVLCVSPSHKADFTPRTSTFTIKSVCCIL
jgi:hypothetical protein